MVALHQPRGPEPFVDDLICIADLVAERPAWMRDALCRERPETNFFPARGESSDPAKDVCRRCLVQRECFEYALELGSATSGIWGGASGRDRREVARLRTRMRELNSMVPAALQLGW